VTPHARIVVDLAMVLDEQRLTAVMYDAVRTGLVTSEQVLATAEILGNRAGCALARTVAGSFDPRFESMLEAEAVAVLVAAGLTWFEPQLEIWDGPCSWRA
jgi:hypothetical protein